MALMLPLPGGAGSTVENWHSYKRLLFGELLKSSKLLEENSML